jgi:hypothetical protein
MKAFAVLRAALSVYPRPSRWEIGLMAIWRHCNGMKGGIKSIKLHISPASKIQNHIIHF